MILVIGDGGPQIAKALEAAGCGLVEQGKQEILVDSSELRRYNAVVIDQGVAWLGPYVNALWETDGLVFILGKIPPLVQALTASRSGPSIKLDNPKLTLQIGDSGAQETVIKSNQPVSCFAIQKPVQGALLGTLLANGQELPLWVTCGRVTHSSLAVADVSSNALDNYLIMLADLIKSQMDQHGIGADAPANTNPSFADIQDMVPESYSGPNIRKYSYLLRRVTRIFNVLSRFTPHKSLQGMDVLDLGCGFGTTTIVSSLLYGLGRIHGVDIDQSLIDVAQKVTDTLNLSNVSFEQGTMVGLERYANQFDAVIVNNAFNYFHDNREFEAASAGFAEALRPGGSVVILTPSRLSPIEAFTKFPGMQFLRRDMANQVISAKGLSGIDYNDIKLPSPFEIIHWMSKAGFEDITVVDAYSLQECELKGYFKPRFYVVATKE